MAAGLGFKTFATGDVLTSTDVNGYLMQGVLVFATTTARDAAITAPQAGQVALTKDTNTIWKYTGSAWSNIDTGGGANSALTSPIEVDNVAAIAATGTVNVDLVTSAYWYYTTNASANFTLNFRGNSTTTLTSILGVGQSISVVFLNTNGATAYYPTVFQIDGSAVTPKWSGGTAPAAGNASAIDAYSFSIIKTAATPTYTVLAGGAVKFA
jgi:hypothetical protein